MNNYKKMLAVVAVFAVGLIAIRWQSTVTAQQEQSVRSAQVEFAQLLILNEKYTFVASGTNNIPRSFDLGGLYRNLGGRYRPTLVNLLGGIGEDGWRLVDISEDRSASQISDTHPAWSTN